MTTINWVRYLIGGLIAAVIFFVTDGMMHEMILKPDWTAVYAGIKAAKPEAHISSMFYFAVFA